MSASQIVTWLVLAALLFWAVGAYNRLVQLRNAIGQAFIHMDVLLKHRDSLIPELVDSAGPYLLQERDALLALVAANARAREATDHARVRPTEPGAIMAMTEAEQVLSESLRRLFNIVDERPDLKADQAVRDLLQQFAGTETTVSLARQAFNEAAGDFNRAADQFPTVLIARLFGLKPAATLQTGAAHDNHLHGRMKH